MNPSDFNNKQIPLQTMTEEQLETIRARAKAATMSPWVYESPYLDAKGIPGARLPQSIARIFDNQPNCENNGKFIAAAIDDVPALLNEIATLRRAVYHYATEMGRRRNKKLR